MADLDLDAVHEAIALAMQKHLPITLPDDDGHEHAGWTMCMCHGMEEGAGPNLTLFEGPVYHRLHVAEQVVKYLAADGFQVVKQGDVAPASPRTHRVVWAPSVLDQALDQLEAIRDWWDAPSGSPETGPTPPLLHQQEAMATIDALRQLRTADTDTASCACPTPHRHDGQPFLTVDTCPVHGPELDR